MPSNLVNLGQRLQTVQSSQPPRQRWYRSHHLTGSFSTTVAVVVVAVAADADAADDAVDVVADGGGSVDTAADDGAAPCASAHIDVVDVASVETQGSSSTLFLTPSQVGTFLYLYCSSLRSKNQKFLRKNNVQDAATLYIARS